MAAFKAADEKDVRGLPAAEQRDSDDFSVGKGDILGLEHTDPVLNAKMHLVNNAIDEIGMTWYQWKLFVLNGFGYAVDSLILLIQSIIASYAAVEFNPGFAYGMTIAVYVGMLVGALFWGLSADVIGRKYAFNLSLLISSVFCIVAGASPNWIVLGLFVSLAAFGSGGNLVLDTTVFLEYLPSQDQWLLTLMACWWGIGQLVFSLGHFYRTSPAPLRWVRQHRQYPATGRPTQAGDTCGLPAALWYSSCRSSESRSSACARLPSICSARAGTRRSSRLCNSLPTNTIAHAVLPSRNCGLAGTLACRTGRDVDQSLRTQRNGSLSVRSTPTFRDYSRRGRWRSPPA